MILYAVIMLTAGIGIPILATLNASLGNYLNIPALAAAITFFVGFIICVIAAITTGSVSFSAISNIPKHFLLAGLLMAFYLISITYIAPKFGIGNAIFFILLGQLISAATIDHFGLFGAQVNLIDFKRVSGLLLMVAGVWIAKQT